MGSHHLNLKWRNHHSNLLSVFSQLLTSEVYADVTLACDGASLRAHKIILSACSPFFHSLFAQHPCQHPIVILKDVPFEDLKVLVDFMYHGEVNITQERLPSFLRTAESLKVKGLSESEAHNRVGPIIHGNPFPPFVSTRPFPEKRPSFGPAGGGGGGASPKAAPNKKRKKPDSKFNLSAPNHGSSMSSTMMASNSSDYEDSVDPMKGAGPSLLDSLSSRDKLMPSLKAESLGDDRADDSEPPVLPLNHDASSSNNNVLEVESYRQLQRMASMLHQTVPQFPMLPLSMNSFALPMMKDRGGPFPVGSNDEDEDEDDKLSGELSKLEEEGNANFAEEVHALTRLPRHKKKDCIVCGNRALGVRRRSRQWCPGCNVGVHVHCFDQLVHYRRHSRRTKNDEGPSLSAKLEELSSINARTEGLLNVAPIEDAASVVNSSLEDKVLIEHAKKDGAREIKDTRVHKETRASPALSASSGTKHASMELG